MRDQKATIKNADMLEEMQQDLVECATQALEKYNIEKDVATHIKEEFDKKHNPTWHRGEELRQSRDTRNQTLHLLLPGPSGYSPVQIWLKAWTVPHTQ